MEFGTETMADNVGAVDVAASEGVAAPTTDSSAVSQSEPQPNILAEPAKETDITATQVFSKRLNEKIAEKEKALWEKVNPVIEKIGGVLPDGRPIKTFEDLQTALAYQEAQKQAQEWNMPVEMYERLTQAEKDALEAKTMLSQYQRKEVMAKEAETLSTDSKWGEFFKAHEAEIYDVADKANCDLGTAKLIVYDRIGPQKVDEEAIANKAIQDFIDKKRTLNKPTEGSGATPVTVAQTPKTYQEARDGAMAYLRSLREK